MKGKQSKEKIKDPFAAREAGKYEKPIASREFILEYLKKRGKPAKLDHIATDLHLTSEGDLEALRRRLKAMCRDGQLNLNRREGFGLIDKMNLIAGRVQGHRDGFGFVIPDDNSSDLTLNARQMQRVFDGDRVLVRVVGLDYKKRREASIVDVLEHNTTQVVGRLVQEGSMSYVVPENKRIPQTILIDTTHPHRAKSGHIVVVDITAQPTAVAPPMGVISLVLGEHLAPGQEIEIALRAHQIPHTFPEAVEKEIASLEKTVPEDAKKNRVDLRQLPLVTIDGEDAQDFDDAVYAEKEGKNYRLIVAIADVSHYVKPGTALDEEAMRRATSVYFPGKVVPMLPEILSNELCSLKPKVDRLCMVCELWLDPNGKIIREDFFSAVMHSAARLTYQEVQMMMDDTATKKKYPTAVTANIEALRQVYSILLKARHKRGALDFETVETQIIFGKNKKIDKIVPRHRNEAHRLIEECMLAANVAVATFLEKQKDLPVLYRVHHGPKEERLENIRKFLHEVGCSLGGQNKPTPKDYAKLLAQIGDRPDAHLIQMMLLRSLAQAVYSPENAGHFGLAYDVYTHFTSPIRRYPDLLIHRALKACANNVAHYPYTLQQMIQLGEHCSLAERRADDATREATLSLKCQFLKDKVGQVFEGVISHVTSFGLFVELKDIYVEGLIHVTSLQNDYYIFDAAQLRLRGERTGKTYRLGDQINVLVARVDVDDKQIDFELNTPTKLIKPKRSATQKRQK